MSGWGTRLRQIISLYVVLEDGSGRKVAEGVSIQDAFVIGEAFENRGLQVIIDPPEFGLIQNMISWGTTDTPPVAVPWRDYLEERSKHETTRETFNALYDFTPANSFVNGYEKWRMKHVEEGE